MKHNLDTYIAHIYEALNYRFVVFNVPYVASTLYSIGGGIDLEKMLKICPRAVIVKNFSTKHHQPT